MSTDLWSNRLHGEFGLFPNGSIVSHKARLGQKAKHLLCGQFFLSQDRGPHLQTRLYSLTGLYKMLAVTRANLAADFADEYGVVHVIEAGVVEDEVRVGPSLVVIVGTRRHYEFLISHSILSTEMLVNTIHSNLS